MTKYITSYNPSKNYEVIDKVEISTESKIKQAVCQANNAKELWQAIGIEERTTHLTRLYNICDKRKEEIASMASKEVGFPISQTTALDLGDGFAYFKWYLENAREILSPETTFSDTAGSNQVSFEPYGTVAVITPWNFPFCNFIWGVIPPLISGNTVVFKHSEECIYFAKLLQEIIDECALPAGVLSQVFGDGETGALLLDQEINMICFTGSTKTGKLIYQKAGEKFIKANLELGGSAPGIIFEDVNIDKIIEPIFLQRFTNCGQVCDGLKRLIVHEAKFDELIDKLTERLHKVKIGDASDPAIELGPLSSKKQLNFLTSQVEDAKNKNCRIITGGNQPKGLLGAYYEPTIICEIDPSMRVWNEEVFGPVLPIIKFKTDEEAIELANNTSYGLGAYIYTNNKDRAFKTASKIKTGMVSINGANYVMPFNPFGGWNNSGIGVAHGRYGLSEMVRTKVVSDNF